MTHQAFAATSATEVIRGIGTLNNVPLTLRHQLQQDQRLVMRKPLHIQFPLFGQAATAEVLYGRSGSCVFFRLDLGSLPFSQQQPVVRQQVLDFMRALRRDTDYLTSDLTLLKNPTTGLLALRSSAVMPGRPGMVDLFNELARFALTARPYFEVLQPLLSLPPQVAR